MTSPRLFLLSSTSTSPSLVLGRSGCRASSSLSSFSGRRLWRRMKTTTTTTRTTTTARFPPSSASTNATTEREDEENNKTFEKILSVLQAHSARRLSVAAECRTLVSNASCTGGGVLSTMASSTETKTKDEEDDESSSYPVGSFAAFAIEEEDADGDESVTTPSTAGLPIFALSQLSSHTRDLLKNKRASLFCAESGGMRPDAARATLVGSVEKIENEEDKEKARERYLKQHPDAFWVDFGDFSWFKMTELKEVKYVGGFGRAANISASEYQSVKVDPVRKFSGPVCKHMNEDHAESTLDIVKMEVFGEENMGLIRSSNSSSGDDDDGGGGGGGGSSSRSRSGGGNKNKSTQDESWKAEMCEIDSIGMTVSLQLGSQNLGKVRIEWPEPALDRKAIKDQIVALTKKAAAAKTATTK